MISSYVVQCMYISFLIPFNHRYRPKHNTETSIIYIYFALTGVPGSQK